MDKNFKSSVAEAKELLPGAVQFFAQHMKCIDFMLEEVVRLRKEKNEMMSEWFNSLESHPSKIIPLTDAICDALGGKEVSLTISDLDDETNEAISEALPYLASVIHDVLLNPEILKYTMRFILREKEMECIERSESDQESFVDHSDEEKSSEQEEVSFVDPFPGETEDSPVVGDGIEESVPKAKCGRPKKNVEKKVPYANFKRAFRGLH